MEKKPIPYLIGKGLTWISFALFAVFAALKLCGAIAWSWWLVCLPFTLPLAFCIVIVALAMYLVRQGVNRDDFSQRP